MITAEGFQAAITGLLQMLPMQRQLTGPALVMAWDSFPMTAKQQLSDEMLHWACAQRLKDPDPPKEMATHLSLLRYLYPLEADRPVVEHGLRSDLAERMAEPDRFHDPSPVHKAYQAPRSLPQGGSWHASQMTPEQLRRHLEVIASQLEDVIAQGEDKEQWAAKCLSHGHAFLKNALLGWWTLKADKSGLARAWITRNPAHARKMLADAMAADAPAVMPDANPVDAFLAGAW